MSTGFSKGDRVGWGSSQGRTRGRVIERRVRDFEFADQHKESALHKLD